MGLSDVNEQLVVLAVSSDRLQLAQLRQMLTDDFRVESVRTFRSAIELLNFFNLDTPGGKTKLRERASVIFVCLPSPGLDPGHHKWLLDRKPPLYIIYVENEAFPVSESILSRRISSTSSPLNAEKIDFEITAAILERDRSMGRALADLIPKGPPLAPKIRVFLCHSSGDKERVRDLYQRLVADDFQCWLDEEDLLGGQDFHREITLAIERSDYVLACISESSINKRGYIQRELKKALDVADEQPEGATFLIPVRLERSEIPNRLKHLHYVDLFAAAGYERLVKSLRRRTPD